MVLRHGSDNASEAGRYGVYLDLLYLIAPM